MNKVFFFETRTPTETEQLLEAKLTQLYQINKAYIAPGYLWMESTADAVRKSDVIIIPITQSFLQEKQGMDELTYVLSYARESGSKLILPLLFKGVTPPTEIQDIQCINVDPENPERVEDAISEINRAILSFEARLDAKGHSRLLKAEKIESKSTEYVEEAISELKQREKSLSRRAHFWYALGYCAIGAGVIASLFFVLTDYEDLSNGNDIWGFVAFAGIKSIFLIGLLLAMAKYSFSLAKSYMDESLKNADRIHAISFGKFFLQAFGEQVDASNVKDIFQHWNISGQSSFATANSDQIEPKTLALAVELAKTLQNETKRA